MSQEQYPEPSPEFDYIPWVDHVYASLRWTEGSLRRLHEMLEHEEVSDELRGKAARAIAWLETARIEAFHAFEKMGLLKSNEIQAKIDVSAIGAETKVKVLDLDAAYIESLLNSAEGKAGYESLREAMLRAVETIRQQAREIGEQVKRNLNGPQKM